MPESRRHLFMTFVGAASVFALEPLLSAMQATGVHPSPPQPKPSPNTPNGNFPPGLKGPPVTTDSRVINKQNQEEIKSDVSRLYEMISELKEQIEHTDANSTLSLSIVKKAQQIEKLAKQIRELAKG